MKAPESKASAAKSFARAGKPKAGSPPPFSLRLTFEERAALDAMAGGRPLGAYIRDQLLGDKVSKRASERRKPRADEVALARLLSALGQSRLSSNLNQIAKAAHMGALPVTPELIDELHEACADIEAMRDALMAGLGLKPGGPP
ncbi:hypothetical protein [Woodsholea maritima]|uniref:hypothetical protein n=1 Tax=Woodsholea maritima TaxID=240237 RepID=UPI00035FAE4A|nr:hypothetical protein [Woodsholea maritima]